MINQRKTLIIYLIVILLLSGLSDICYADDFYSNHATGWHWYDDPKSQPEIEKEIATPDQKDPNAIVEAARQKIKTALNKVISEPTVANLEEYIALQNQLSERAAKVSDIWQQVLLKDPQLNYSLSHPTNNVALQVYNEQESQEKVNAIRLFASKTGLFFFYKSTCPYCRRFAPILRNFAAHNGITIIPITMDGISLPEFPNSKPDSGQAAQFNVTMTPSLFAVNPYTQKAFPVAYGLTSETELRDNIYKIVTKYQEDKL